MPAIKLFGRRWAVSSDDFVFPAVTEGILRFVWFIVTLCLYVLHPNDQCPGVDHLQAYILVSLVHNGIVIIISICTAYTSSRGTIRNAMPRRRLPIILYARCVAILFEFIWNIVGSVWLSRTADLTTCDPTIVAAGKFTLIGSWLLLFVFIVGFWLIFDPLGNVRHDDVKMTDQAKRLWKWRLQLLFLCASGGSDKAKAAFEDVAELLTGFFNDTDLVLTDLWAGMLLLANRELAVMNDRLSGRVDRVKATVVVEQPQHRLEDGSSEDSDLPSWMNLKSASRMMEFALGVYGWPYYVCAHGCTLQPFCDLLHKMHCCTQCRCDNVIVIKDNCCQCNTAAMLLHTGISEADLFYVSLHNEIWETPFVACLDHRTRSIVVAIRGSLSLRDALTDLCMREDPFQLEEQFGFGHTEAAESLRGVHVHKGMFWSARYVYSKLENEKILDDLFVLQPEYDLVITGHSLGAGVAVLLAMLLRPKYANVRCFAFSPPGCVISDNALPFTQNFVCSVIVGDDLVPRLSMQSMERFKSNIMDVLEHCDRQKWEILLTGCFKLLCARRTNAINAEIEDHGNRPAYDVENPVSNGVPRGYPTINSDVITLSTESVVSQDAPLIVRSRSVQSYTEERNGGAGETNGVQEEVKIVTRLHCPGRIMHIASPSRSGPEDVVTSFEARISWKRHDYFGEIWLSSSMINDHMPYVVAAVLKEAVKSTDHPMVSTT